MSAEFAYEKIKKFYQGILAMNEFINNSTIKCKSLLIFFKAYYIAL